MINNKSDYTFYLEQDRLALNRDNKTFISLLKDIIYPDYIWRFQRLLRKCEYYKNVKRKHSIFKLYYLLLKIKFRRLSLKLGFSIPENVFGPGLAIIHYGSIIVNAEAKVGTNCRIQACTNIGQSGGKYGSPIIGDNVYIGPGAKIYGKIIIANNVAIAANAAVAKSFLNENVIIGGVPAKEIGQVDIKQIIKHL